MNQIEFRPSNIRRRLLCPGSGRMEMGLPNEDSEESREGTLLHSYLSHPNYQRAVLKPHQREILDRADELTKQAIDTVEKDVGVCFKPTDKDYRETKLSMLGSRIPFEGTPDLARYYLPGEASIILDFKTGYGVNEPADTNIQLRAYCVLSYDFSPTKIIYVGIIQPRASYLERMTLARYTPEDIEDSRAQLISIMEASSDPEAPLNPSEDACRYCRARLFCPAFQKAMIVPEPLTPDKALSKTARIAYLEQRLAEINDETLAKVIDAERFGKMIHDPLYDEARKRGETDFWKIAKETEVRDITDVRRALSLLSLAGLDKADIFDCVQGVSLTKLTEKLNKLHPNWTVKESNEWINRKLASVIEKQTRKARVLRK